MNKIHRAGLQLGCGIPCLLAASLGCNSQADPTYAGEPLAQISGVVEAPLTRGTQEQDVKVGIFWLTDVAITYECRIEIEPAGDAECISTCGPTPDCYDTQATLPYIECVDSCPGEASVSIYELNELNAERAVGEITPTLTSFPAQFQLDLLQPPPEDALTELDGGARVAVGGFALVDPSGAPYDFDVREAEGYPSWLLGGSTDYQLFYTAEPIATDSFAARFFGFGKPVEPGFHLLRNTEDTFDISDHPAALDSPVTLVLGDPEDIFGALPGTENAN